VAKARVRLKDLNKTLKAVTQEVARLRGRGATPAAERQLRALHKKLTTASRALAGSCPDTQFRNFEVAAPVAGARKRKTKRTRGTR